MKVFIAHLTAESNEHVKDTLGVKNFRILYGQESIEAMHIRDIFESEGIEIIPSIYASSHPGGMIDREAFDYIEREIIGTLKKNIHDIDGLYLQFHGASGVNNLEEVSAEHYLIKRIREIVGEYMPIAMVVDPHGNMTSDLTDKVNIIRSYRESPHSDQIESERLVASKLINLMQNRRILKPIIKKLPILVGGERSMSKEEPVISVNKKMDEIEKTDEKVFSISWHVGYLRHDDDKLGAAIIVIPSKEEYREHCEKIAEDLCEYIWRNRKEFRFRGNFYEPMDSIRKAILFDGGNVVITDSGDNCGAGGNGKSTILLRKFLDLDLKGKKVLFAGINDKKSHFYLSKKSIGEDVDFNLGEEEDIYSKSVNIKGKLKKIGDEYFGEGKTGVRGESLGKNYVVELENKDIDIIVLDKNLQYGYMGQFNKAGINFHDYDIVIVKMGYLDTYLIPETDYHIMALTDGSTNQRSEKIDYKRIPRPMWPIDDFSELYYIER